MAGLTRLGFLLGPFLGAAVVHLVGTRGGFLVQLVAVLVAGVLMAALPAVDGGRRWRAPGVLAAGAVLAGHRRVLAHVRRRRAR